MAATAHPLRMTPVEPAIDRIEGAEELDAVGEKVGQVVRDTVPDGPVKDGLSGTWLGHAVHPMLTDLVLGSFTSATVLDLVGGRDSDQQSQRLLEVGIAAAVPTALTGANDWADSEAVDPAVRRVGLAHAGLNIVALGLYAASLVARRRGSHSRGVLFGLAGGAVSVVSGYLGGHLSLARGVGPDQTVYDRGPEEWSEIPLDPSSVAEGKASRVIVDDTPLLVTRSAGRLLAIHDRCSHRGCSLSDGEIAAGSVTCACHGSRFRLDDGAVEHGPASAPQPSFAIREREGGLEVRRVTPAETS